MSRCHPTPKLKTLLWALFVLTIIVLLSGCEGGLPFRFPARTAKDAVLQDFQANVRRRKASVDWNTVEILQQKQVQADVVFALLSFQERKQNSQWLSCLYYYGAKQSGEHWSVQGSGGGCLPAEELPMDGSPISAGYSGGWSSDPAGLTFFIASGVVYDDSITQITITWDDGVQQLAKIENHTYMAFRLEVCQVDKIEAQDLKGNTVSSKPQD